MDVHSSWRVCFLLGMLECLSVNLTNAHLAMLWVEEIFRMNISDLHSMIAHKALTEAGFPL